MQTPKCDITVKLEGRVLRDEDWSLQTLQVQQSADRRRQYSCYPVEVINNVATAAAHIAPN